MLDSKLKKNRPACDYHLTALTLAAGGHTAHLGQPCVYIPNIISTMCQDSKQTVSNTWLPCLIHKIADTAQFSIDLSEYKKHKGVLMARVFWRSTVKKWCQEAVPGRCFAQTLLAVARRFTHIVSCISATSQLEVEQLPLTTKTMNSHNPSEQSTCSPSLHGSALLSAIVLSLDKNSLHCAPHSLLVQ